MRLQILRVGAFNEKRLFLQIYHVLYLHAPVGVFKLLMHDFIGDLGNTYAVCRSIFSFFRIGCAEYKTFQKQYGVASPRARNTFRLHLIF